MPKVHELHSWQLTVAQAERLQLELAPRVCREGRLSNPRFIAGADISAPDPSGMARAAIVVLTYPEFEIVEIEETQGQPNFPYIPGLLSFRESPLVLAAWQKLSVTPDLLLVDGQGIAHPRRFGIASHLGLLLDIPTIGCAKSRLCGTFRTLGTKAGNYTEITDKDEVIGVALRTKNNTAPVYVSIGHKVDLRSAIEWTLKCCKGYRLPEPSRLAHLVASGKKLSIIQSGYQQKLFG